MIDTYEKVVCRECGKAFKQITTAHLDNHGMRLMDYEDKYPGTPVISQKTLDLRYEKQGGDKHPWIGKKHTEETKQKLRQPRPHRQGVPLTEEHKENISKALTGITRSDKTREKISKSRTGLKMSMEGRIKLSQKRKAAYHRDPEAFQKKYKIYPAKPGKDHFNYGKPAFSHPRLKYVRANGKSILLRSTWEQEVCKYLDRMRFEWEYEWKRYELDDITYCPDFTIFNEDGAIDKVVEVKGWMNDTSIKQITQFIKNYPNVPFEVWDKDELLSKGIYVK